MKRPKNIVNEAELDWVETTHGTRSASRRRRLGTATGLEKLGASLYELPPGKRAFPRHWHAANEEALYILSGAGTLRLHDESVAVATGDFIGLPSGAAHVHELVNTGSEVLRYLTVSTMHAPDVVHYPDSKKLMTVEGRGVDGKPLGGVYSEAAPMRYWDGED